MADVVQPDPNSLQIPGEIHTHGLRICSVAMGTWSKWLTPPAPIFWSVNMLTFPCPSPTWVNYSHQIPVTFQSFQFIMNIQSRDLRVKCGYTQTHSSLRSLHVYVCELMRVQWWLFPREKSFPRAAYRQTHTLFWLFCSFSSGVRAAVFQPTLHVVTFLFISSINSQVIMHQPLHRLPQLGMTAASHPSHPHPHR